MVAGCTSSNKIVPAVAAALMAGKDVVDGQFLGFLTTVLAGVIVPPEDLGFGKLHGWARTFDHVG